MFCPQCGSTQPDELKFCKACGANLFAVRGVMATREMDDNFDWTKTWVAEMFMTHDERQRRKGKTPEIKRLEEIKAGVITASVGIGVMITLYVVMGAIVLNPNMPPETAVLLRSVWVAGVIPLLVGLALVINGIFVGKRIVRASTKQTDEKAQLTAEQADAGYLPPAPETNPLEREFFSVTDDTTRHLADKQKVKRQSDN